MGVVSGLRDLAPAFEKATGHKVVVVFEQAGALNDKINAGAAADIAALQPDAIDNFIKQGKMVAGTRTNFAQAGVGVSVKAGAPKPDISTPEAFKTAMLNAKSIGYSRGGSGLISAKVMEKLGIADQLKARTKFIDGRVAEIVARRGRSGLQQINVLIPVVGADYVVRCQKGAARHRQIAAAVLTVSNSRRPPERSGGFTPRPKPRP
jgi:molybdate transport system substrate-binding protein